MSTITTLLSSFSLLFLRCLKTMLYEYKLREKIHNLKKKESKTSVESAVTPEYTYVYLGRRVVVKAGQSPLTSCTRPLL